jgi:hypothetical protein
MVMGFWKGRVLVAMWGCLPFSAGCSPQGDPGSSSDTQTASPAACQGACVYQLNTDDTCAAGPQPSPDGWFTKCEDMSCADVSYDPMGMFDPISGCATSIVYRYPKAFSGTCDDWEREKRQLPDDKLEPEGVECASNAECASTNCVGTDSLGYSCANDCQDGGGCSVGFTCDNGYCVPPCLQ